MEKLYFINQNTALTLVLFSSLLFALIGIGLSAKAEKSGTDKAEVGVVAYATRD